MRCLFSLALTLNAMICFSQTSHIDQDSAKKKSLFNSLSNHFEQNNFDSVTYYTQKIFELPDNEKNDIAKIRAASAYSHATKDSTTAFLYFNKIEKKLLEKKNSEEALGELYMYKANRYFNDFSDDEALRIYLKADSIHTSNHIKSFTSVMVLNGICDILMRSQSDDSPLEINQVLSYLNRGYKDSDSLNLLVPKGIFLYKKGEIMFHENELSQAKSFFEKSIKVSEQIDNYTRIALSYGYLSQIFENENKLDSALFFQEKAVKTTEKIDDKRVILTEYLRLGSLYNILGNYDGALEKLLLAKKIYESILVDRKEVKHHIEYELAQSYFGKKNYKVGYEYLMKSKSTMEEIQLTKNIEKVNEIEAKYQTEKKNHEIQLLKYQNEVTKKEKRNQRNLLIGGILMLFSVVLFLYFLYANNKRNAENVKKLYANISHEFRTPLTLINGPVLNQLNKESNNSKDKKELQLIKKNADRLLLLVNQMLDLSLIDAGQLKVENKPGNLFDILEQLVHSFNYKAQEKSVEIISNIDKKLSNSYFDAEAMEKIVGNLLSNAVKYTPENGEIELNAKQDKKQVLITVVNTIEENQIKNTHKLFERFYQQNSTVEGVGIGLALVKELVKVMKGTISIDRKEEQIVFEVSLPNISAQPNFVEEKQKESKEDFSHSLELSENENSAQLPETLLIIEDHEELREFMASLFNTTYNVIEAPNGKVGIEKAIQEVPDLIISDILMPYVSGIEVCAELKSNEITSHIPIILLTAKSGDVNEIKGLQTGAEAYISKPFNNEKLILTVKNLLEYRRVLQNKFKDTFDIEPELSVNSTEDNFLKRLQKVIAENITNPDFKTEQFCKEMFMSRMQLHRKLKSLTNMTTTEFLRSQRLKLALPLLKNSELTISEIAYQVGYNSSSYFVKSFKQVYGKSPKEYADKNF